MDIEQDHGPTQRRFDFGYFILALILLIIITLPSLGGIKFNLYSSAELEYYLLGALDATIDQTSISINTLFTWYLIPNYFGWFLAVISAFFLVRAGWINIPYVAVKKALKLSLYILSAAVIFCGIFAAFLGLQKPLTPGIGLGIILAFLALLLWRYHIQFGRPPKINISRKVEEKAEKKASNSE